MSLADVIRKGVRSRIEAAQQRSEGRATRITWESIEAVDARGRYMVRGAWLTTTGKKIFQVGERVAVLWQDGKPFKILGHSWRRAQFHPIAVPVAGEIQSVAAALDGGDLIVFLTSNVRGTFALNVSQALQISAAGARDILAKFCENDTSVVMVQWEEDSGGQATFRAIALQIQREPDAGGIPAGEEPITVAGEEFPTFLANLLLQVSRSQENLVARTLRVQVNLKVDGVRYQSIGQTDTISAGQATLSETVHGSVDKTLDFTALSDQQVVAVGNTPQDAFCLRSGDAFSVTLLFGESEDWRVGDQRQSEHVLAALSFPLAIPGDVFSAWDPPLPPLLRDGVHMTAEVVTGQSQLWDPFPAVFTAFSDDQGAFSNLEQTVFRCPHLYLVDLVSGKIVYRNVEPETILEVDGSRFFLTHRLVRSWDEHATWEANENLHVDTSVANGITRDPDASSYQAHYSGGFLLWQEWYNAPTPQGIAFGFWTRENFVRTAIDQVLSTGGVPTALPAVSWGTVLLPFDPPYVDEPWAAEMGAIQFVETYDLTDLKGVPVARSVFFPGGGAAYLAVGVQGASPFPVAVQYTFGPRGPAVPKVNVFLNSGFGGGLLTGLYAYRVAFKIRMNRRDANGVPFTVEQEFPGSQPALAQVSAAGDVPELTWGAQGNVVDAAVYRRKPGSEAFELVARVPFGTNSYLDAGAPAVGGQPAFYGKPGWVSLAHWLGSQQFRGDGPLAFRDLIGSTQPEVAAQEGATFRRLAELNFLPEVLAIGARWLVAATGTPQRLYLIDRKDGVVRGIEREFLDQVLGEGVALEKARLIASEGRLFFVGDEAAQEKLLRQAIDQTVAWSFSGDTQKPVDSFLGGGEYDMGILFPRALEQKT